MKKTLLKMLTLICVLCCSFCLVACGGNNDNNSNNGGGGNNSSENSTGGTSSGGGTVSGDEEEGGSATVVPGQNFLYFELNPDGVSYYLDDYFSSFDKNNLVIPSEYEGKPVTIIGPRACKSGWKDLVSVVIPSSIIEIKSAAFLQCGYLTQATLNEGLKIIGENAFQEAGLTSITIPHSVEKIGEHAFIRCNDLQTVVIGNGVKTIDGYAFEYCTKLKTITIGSGVTSFGTAMLGGCTNLTDIYYKGTKAQWDAIEKQNGEWNYSTGDYIIHCTDGDYEKEPY